MYELEADGLALVDPGRGAGFPDIVGGNALMPLVPYVDPLTDWAYCACIEDVDSWCDNWLNPYPAAAAPASAAVVPIALDELDVDGFEGLEFVFDGLFGLDELVFAGEAAGGGPYAELGLKKSAADPLPVSGAGVLTA